jgi:proteasome lid subunit RPN8/RPN11
MKFELTDALVQALHDHAAAEFPRECCGVVVVDSDGRADYLRCANIAPADGHDTFVMSPYDYATAADLGEVVAIVHSHPNASANPSMADRAWCEKSGLPWLIVGWPSGVIKQLEPTGWCAPYKGREFHHGALDCYTLIQDWYHRELQVDLQDFDREDGWWENRPDRPAKDLYMDGFGAAGFVRVRGEPLRHDVIVMNVGSDKGNHGAVYVGNGEILHHLHSRLSEQVVYGGYWQRHTVALLRHRSRAAPAPAAANDLQAAA